MWHKELAYSGKDLSICVNKSLFYLFRQSLYVDVMNNIQGGRPRENQSSGSDPFYAPDPDGSNLVRIRKIGSEKTLTSK